MEMMTIERQRKKHKELEMICECCGEKVLRWEVDMVEPDSIVFESNEVLESFSKELVEFNFACPECVTDLALIPLQTQRAKEFREKNEKLREVVSPVLIH